MEGEVEKLERGRVSEMPASGIWIHVLTSHVMLEEKPRQLGRVCVVYIRSGNVLRNPGTVLVEILPKSVALKCFLLRLAWFLEVAQQQPHRLVCVQPLRNWPAFTDYSREPVARGFYQSLIKNACWA